MSVSGGGGGGGGARGRHDVYFSAVAEPVSVSYRQCSVIRYPGMMDALVNKFNQQAMKHLESQSLNPFSDRFSRSPSPRPRFSKEEYGK